MASKSSEASAAAGNKSSWPELVGIHNEVAEMTIQKENPSVKAVIVVPEGSFVTLELRRDRVRLWVDQQGLVTRVPNIG
ncbi:Proteinase inhibitor [Parasponia andersonii]|uniref:Proteinase inhibitor n=1 Tax=Parasponia andersonii TaxID=3476 RepID=A0A2P5BWW3_PARAD|nr:Proteinase inhibitor [Parasponia andersonii]